MIETKKPIERKSAKLFHLGIIYIVLFIVLLIMIIPFLWTILTSLKTYEEAFRPLSLKISWRFQNYSDLFFLPAFNFAMYIINSLFVTTTALIGTLISSCMAAYAFAKLRFRGREILFWVYLATLMVPIQTRLIPMFLLMRGIGLLDNLQSLIYPVIFDVYGVFLLRQFLKAIPNELEESAIIDGASYYTRFVKVVLPQIKPAIASLVIISTVTIWNDYIRPLVFINSDDKRTLTMGLALLQGGQGGDGLQLAMAGTIVAILPIIIVFLSFQKYFVTGITFSGIKG